MNCTPKVSNSTFGVQFNIICMNKNFLFEDRISLHTTTNNIQQFICNSLLSTLIILYSQILY